MTWDGDTGGTDRAWPGGMRWYAAALLVMALAPRGASAQPIQPPPAQPTEPEADFVPDSDEPAPAPAPEPAAPESAPGPEPAPAQAPAPTASAPSPTAPTKVGPAPDPAAGDVAVEADAAPAKQEDGFAFGSYGRVSVGTDLDGGTPESVNVVSHGSRVVESTYLELDLYYRLKARRGVNLTTVTTLGFGDDLFHLNGEFDAEIALRNFYLEAQKGPFSLWAGSRMYRGNDIYLLDFWPLDESNTVGGGGDYRQDRIEGGFHVGINRLLDPYQFQTRSVLAPGSFGAQEIPLLDRQRYTASAKTSYRFYGPAAGGLAIKGKLYGEIQGVGSGTRQLEDDPDTFEQLPSDFGYTLGAQLSSWGFGPDGSHVNAFIKWSQGLTAVDELAVPMAFAPTLKTYPGASELLFALSGNHELFGRGGVMGAMYSRRFIDGDPNEMDRDDGWEYIVDVRPRVKVIDALEAAVDLSYQVRFPRAVSPNELTAMDPAVFQIAPMVMYSPFGAGAYARPQFRLVYRGARLNDGARDLYPLEDPRRDREWVHFLGVQAEWWFNSTYR